MVSFCDVKIHISWKWGLACLFRMVRSCGAFLTFMRLYNQEKKQHNNVSFTLKKATNKNVPCEVQTGERVLYLECCVFQNSSIKHLFP